MIIKKYQGATENEAVVKAKEDLGSDAVIMNVKSVKQRGLCRLFKKDYVEITAAVDEPDTKEGRKSGKVPLKDSELKNRQKPDETEQLPNRIETSELKEPAVTTAIQERLENLAQLLERQMQEEPEQDALEQEKETQDHNSRMVKLVYEQLLNNEVTEENSREIMREIDNKDNLQLDDLLASVYQKIVLKLGQMKTVELSEKKPKIIFFIGPTGVGKTTTIAKLASKYKLEKKAKIAIITADTYRVAAGEQIRTYANILSAPIEVVYHAGELKPLYEKYQEYDLILVDTAGRSHKNEEQKEDIQKLLETALDYPHEIYLVVSATTKYKDLVRITQTYSDISDYRLLFTKIDETDALGNILNIRMLTQKPLSYTTFGQNVPEDISVTDAQGIAKQLLGGNESWIRQNN
ncbi:gTP-binding signal recognition particle SRP54 G-domain [Clostridium sp. CAG:632]|nr:gTP-binding signal recognition particle SRP54 G-domain [Clostridium sp. CAG:632]